VWNARQVNSGEPRRPDAVPRRRPGNQYARVPRSSQLFLHRLSFATLCFFAIPRRFIFAFALSDARSGILAQSLAKIDSVSCRNGALAFDKARCRPLRGERRVTPFLRRIARSSVRLESLPTLGRKCGRIDDVKMSRPAKATIRSLLVTDDLRVSDSVINRATEHANYHGDCVGIQKTPLIETSNFRA